MNRMGASRIGNTDLRDVAPIFAESFDEEGEFHENATDDDECLGQEFILAAQGSSVVIAGIGTAMYTHYSTRDFRYVPVVKDKG